MWPFKWAMPKKRGLRTMIVHLLSSSPKNGVEIMDEIEKMTNGWWRPSPGSVYPLLSDMEQEGLIKQLEDKRYELTEKAHTEVDESYGPWFMRPRPPGMSRGPWSRSPRSVDDVVGQVNSFVSYMEDVNKTAPEKVEAHKSRLKDLAERLANLTKDKQDAQS